MDIKTYLDRRKEFLQQQKQFRALCPRCIQSGSNCYCSNIVRIDSKMKFVILIHPIERRSRVATGRMSFLSLENAELIEGQDFSQDVRVQRIIDDPKHQCFVLYPGREAKNVSDMNISQRKSLFDPQKIPVIFVIDGTWATAKKTMKTSHNLRSLPQIAFTPSRPSQFRVRKQPHKNCLSTIEAIHHLLELFDEGSGLRERPFDRLLTTFNSMVEKQIEYVRDSFVNPRTTSFRKPRNPSILEF